MKQAAPRIANAMTVDVEDYFHVSAFEQVIDRTSWDGRVSRVERNTRRLLEMMAERQMRATYFVLGWVAERYPQLVAEIAAAGHEIACHGYSHRLVYNQSPEEFRQETLRAKALLEDQAQCPVRGYRAASYSITARSAWALDVLVDAGFDYDSSIFPVRHDRYGMPGTPRFPYRIAAPSGRELVEFPLTTLPLGGATLPIAGGGYFRLYPYAFSRWGLARVNREGEPFIFYLHPWEIDPGQPRIQAGLLSRFRHYNNLGTCEARLGALMDDFSFTTVAEVLAQRGLLPATPAASCAA